MGINLIVKNNEVSSTLEKLIDDPDVNYDLEANVLVAELLDDTHLANLLKTGEVPVDFDTTKSEVIILHQLLFQLLKTNTPQVAVEVGGDALNGNLNSQGQLDVSGFRTDAIDVVRKIVGDIGKMKKLGKELQEKKQVNKEVFNSVLQRLSVALEIAVLKVLGNQRETSRAIMMEVWKNFAQPEVHAQRIEPGVINPAEPETVTFEED